ncbi:MAG: hypothetical protein GY801_16875 [bacterium]|nr:hypothetical protein [bacterium]
MGHSLHTHLDKHLSPKFQHIILPCLLFGGLLIFAAFVRFNQITIQGTVGSDTFGYLKEAKLWVDGKPPQFIQKMIFYRPAIFLLHSWAIRIGGWNDYSIKMLHAFMDMCSMSFIFLIAYILSKNWWNSFF